MIDHLRNNSSVFCYGNARENDNGVFDYAYYLYQNMLFELA